MLAQLLQDMNKETEWFILIILLFSFFFHARFTPAIAQKGPAFLTTIGILGTFFGIGVGLMQFNPNNVQASVPSLINGIKTAVWASAFGIFFALTLKMRDLFTEKKKLMVKKTSGSGSGSPTVDLINSIRSVEQALVGNQERSVLSQIKLARQENNQHLIAMSQSLDAFCDKVAESNARALVKALNEIMEQFNVKLNEHIGDNFKQLNLAVEKMLIWQENYSHQISQVIDQQNIATENMAHVSDRYKQLVSNAEVFNNIAQSMSALLTGLDIQRNQIDASLRSLASLINTASTGLPQIEKQVIEMTRQLTEGVKATNDEFNQNIKKLIERTKEQVIVLDNALSEELTKSLDSFGRQLASLSQKFAEDYTPITERLQAILKIGG